MHQHDHTEGRRGLRARLGASSVRTRSVLAATGVLVVGISATGVAATGSAILEGQRNGTATQETQIISNVGATSTATGGFSTRQSNLSSTGGGAVYGCRSTTGGTAATPPTNPCIRANNLSSGYAFEFNASSGLSAGVITVGKGGDGAKPFTTNATGVATGLNADRVDGKRADEFLGKTEKAADAGKLDGKNSAEFAAAGDLLFAAVTSTGNVAASRGGTTTATVTGTTFTVTFPKDVSKCSFSATQNGVAAIPGLALAASSAGTNKVSVDEAATPVLATPVPFHLQVIC
jgi:hypothetical protein